MKARQISELWNRPTEIRHKLQLDTRSFFADTRFHPRHFAPLTSVNEIFFNTKKCKINKNNQPCCSLFSFAISLMRHRMSSPSISWYFRSAIKTSLLATRSLKPIRTNNNQRTDLLRSFQRWQGSVTNHSTTAPKPSTRTVSTTVTNTHHPIVEPAAPPSYDQLTKHFVNVAIPMIGFGVMDQTIMLQAGNAIDCTLGVALGLSTLAAAAYGQIVSNAVSVLFGGVVERTAAALGMPSPHFTHAQRHMPIVARTTLAATFFGVTLGCILGLFNLMFIDTKRAQELKIMASLEDEPYEIQASNAQREDATVFTIRGPDHVGLLAAIASTFRDAGLSLKEVYARPSVTTDGGGTNLCTIEDVFVVQSHEGGPVDNEKLQEILKMIEDATSWKKKISVQPTGDEA